MAVYNNCIRSPHDLVTPHEQVRAGFIEIALEKNRKAQPYIEDAKTLKVYASRAKTPMDLLEIGEIRSWLLTAAGLSDKSLVYFSERDKSDAIKKMIDEILIPAGNGFVDELVFRFLLIRGDSLGGSIRNWIGSLAETKLKRKLLSVLTMQQIDYDILFKTNKQRNKWTSSMFYEENYEVACDICAISWIYNGCSKVLFFNSKIPLVKKNVDICLYRGTPETYDSGKIVKHDEKAIMFGELKGGFDPAGADEHWKTGNSALGRIIDAFGKYRIKFSFVGAAIEKDMADEIYRRLEDGSLTNAANLTDNTHLTNYCEWLVKLQ